MTFLLFSWLTPRARREGPAGRLVDDGDGRSTYAFHFVPGKFMQLVADNMILLAWEKLCSHGSHGTTQQLVRRVHVAAVDQGKECITALPV